MATPFDQALAVFISRSAYVLVVQELATKWRLELAGGYLLDLYKRLWGWDNAPHHPALVNFPHHVHQPDGAITPIYAHGAT